MDNFEKKLKKKEYDKLRASLKKDEIRKQKREYYLRNRDNKLEYSKKYREKNPEKTKNATNRWRLINIERDRANKREWIKNNKSKDNEYRKNRRKTDLLFKLKSHLRSMLHQIFKQYSYTKSSRTHEVIGCTFEEFKQHLESKFEVWMSWDNHGKYNGALNFGWDIDHVIPLSSAKTEQELIKLNHYTNLQPLCSKINRDIKKNKI